MFTKISRVLSALLIAGILLGSASFPTDVRADTTITVTTTDDELNSDGDCSLREAIRAANTDSAVDACPAGSGADTITVPAGIYTLTITGTGEDANATGDLDITDSVTINGAGADATIIQAGTDSTNGIDRVFQIAAGIIVSIFDVTIAYGRQSGGWLPKGGGIANYGILTVTNSSFLGNSATYGGGGIYNSDTLNVVNSKFVNNRTFEYGGGGGVMNSGSLTVTDSTFTGNRSLKFAGGISNLGTMAVTNSTFSDNIAGNGGGIYNENGYMTVTNSTFLDNKANSSNYARGGGGIYNDGANNTGGGNAVVTNSTFSANEANNGGGIFNGFGTLTVLNSTFSENTARSLSGGGSIFNVGASYGTIKIYNSILSNTTSSGFDCYKTSGTISGSHNLIEMDASGTYACGTTAPIHADPNLGPLADNGGPTQTFALLPGSPAIDAGDDSICAAAPVNNTSQNGVTRPQGVHCDIGSYELPVTIISLTLQSVGTKDGWILESSETSGVGGTMNVNGQAIVLGDDATDKQYRSILHFNTSSLPDNATIMKVTLKIKKKAVVGTDPFTTHQYIKVGIRSGGFSNNTALQLTDFQSAASKNWIGTIKNTPVGDWYSAVLNKLAFPFVNLTSATQFRLSFALDDDNDNLADYMQFFSGNAAVADRPQLIVEYYTP